MLKWASLGNHYGCDVSKNFSPVSSILGYLVRRKGVTAFSPSFHPLYILPLISLTYYMFFASSTSYMFSRAFRRPCIPSRFTGYTFSRACHRTRFSLQVLIGSLRLFSSFNDCHCDFIGSINGPATRIRKQEIFISTMKAETASF